MRVFDDGTLLLDDQKRIANLDERIEIISREEREDRALSKLKSFPLATAFRQQHPLALKLLDLPLLSDDPLVFIDSDILIVRRFSMEEIKSLPAFLLREDDQGYSAQLLRIKALGKRIPDGGNTGFFKLPIDRYNLNYIEYFLSRSDLVQIPSMVEQTLLSILLASGSCYQINHKQFPCSKYCLEFSPEETVALHFMYGHKSIWQEYAHRAKTTESSTIQATKMKQLSYATIVKRKLSRMKCQLLSPAS